MMRPRIDGLPEHIRIGNDISVEFTNDVKVSINTNSQ